MKWFIGQKLKVFGTHCVVVGISTMIYDDDCAGEPEWKITKEIQEVAIADDSDKEITFQKPSWHSVKDLEENLLNVSTEQCFCQSYIDDNGKLKDCTCGKCAELPTK